MHVKLVSPKLSMRPMDSAWKVRMSPPLSLLVLGALTPARHRVTLADENVGRIRLDDRPGLVGLTVKADTFERSCRIARAYRRRGVPVVMGGIHPTACPEDCAPHADAVVVGEAEPTWARLLGDAEAGRLRPLYRPAGPVDPAAIPVPRWDLLLPDRYLFTNTVRVGRGCPWRCDFCYNSSPNLDARYRIKPLDRIVSEIESLGTRHVLFIDDNFIGCPARVRALLPVLRGMGLTWHAAVSADIGRREGLLDAMAGAGCRSLFIGFETVNEENLQRCHKVQNRIGQYGRTIARIHARGIMVNASVVFGFDADDETVFDRTVDWLTARRVATMTAHILTPYPGTRLHRRLEAAGRLLHRDLSRYNTAYAVFRPARMSPAALEAGYRRAYARFYSWANILRRRPESPAQRAAFLAFNLVYRKFGKLTCGAGKLVGMRRAARWARALAYPERRAAGTMDHDPAARLPHSGSTLRAPAALRPLFARAEPAGGEYKQSGPAVPAGETT